MNSNNITYNECKYLIVEKEEIKRMGQNSLIKPEPIIHELCKHPEVRSRRTKFDCEPDKHSWCPYNKEKCST